MNDRFTAANSAQKNTHLVANSIRPLQPRATHLPLHIKVTQMMGQDYVFLCSVHNILSNKACQQQAFEIRENLQLDKSRTEFVIASVHEDGHTQYQRCLVNWVDNYPVGITRQGIDSAAQQDYYDTLLEHSEAFTTKLL